MAETAIEVEGLTKLFGEQVAVNSVSFRVPFGQVLGFLGPNGAGKTTTMRIITGFISPDAGSVRVAGYSPQRQPDEVRRLIGYLPENNPLYLDMPVMEFLEFTARLHGIRGAVARKRISEIVDVCGLDTEKHKRIGELSRGYRQRVGLAQALLHDPPILILDEPTSGLDPNQTAEVRALVRQLGKEKTIILSTHILPEVEATCDRILIIHRGRIVADGTPHQLKEAGSAEAYLRVQIEGFRTPQEVMAALTHLDGIRHVERGEGENVFIMRGTATVEVRRQLFRLCVEKGWTILELQAHTRTLEEVFRQLTLKD